MSASKSSPKAVGQLQQALSAFWLERDQRERNLITLAVSVAVFGLLYLLFIAPALNGRAQLEKRLPNLRQQTLTMQSLAREAAALSTLSSTPAPPMSKESIEAALNRKGLKPQSVVLIGETAKVQLAATSFAGLIDWLNEMQKFERLTVVDANIVALPQVDTVNAILTLRQ